MRNWRKNEPSTPPFFSCIHNIWHRRCINSRIIDDHGAEFNNLYSYLYDSCGIACFVSIKLILVIVVLLAAHILSKRGGYWLINEWLTALIIGGIMAMCSNLSGTYDIIPVNPYNVILCYLVLTFVFLYAGDRIDNNEMNVKNG